MADVLDVTARASATEESRVLTKAVIRGAAILKLSQAELARILGVSPATITRMHKGNWHLKRGDGKSFELAQLLLRLFRGIDAITGDDTVTAAWLRNGNLALQGKRPIDLVQSVRGLIEVVDYVDFRRAPL